MGEIQTFNDSVGAVELTDSLVEEYLEDLSSRGRNVYTVKKYRNCLRELRVFLLREDRPLTIEAVELWRDSLEEDGFSTSSVNARMSAAKGLLEYHGILKTALHHDPVNTKQPQPMPSRTEYLRLLSFIRAFGTKREYFLVKIFRQIGIDVSDLPRLTVEACQEGEFMASHGQPMVIPSSLRQELIQYASEQHICTGPLIITRNGRPVDRSNVNHILSDAALKAGLSPEKFSPSALGRMCRKAQSEIWEKLEPLYMQSYEQMLDTEQVMVAWTPEQ